MTKRIGCAILAILLITTIIIPVLAIENYTIEFSLNQDKYKFGEYVYGSGRILLGEATASEVPVTLTVEDESGKSVLLVEQYTTDANGNFQVKLKVPYGTTEGFYVMKLKASNEEKEVTFKMEEGSSDIVLESIDIKSKSNTTEIKEGETLKLQLIGKMSDGTTVLASELMGVRWSSLDESIAKVDDTGVVTGISEGEVKIIAKVGALTDDIKLTVKAKNTTGGSSSSSKRRNKKTRQETEQGKVIISRDKAGNKIATFEIDNDKIKKQINDKESHIITIDASLEKEANIVSVVMDSDLISKARKMGKKLEIDIGSALIEIDPEGIKVEEGTKIELRINVLKGEKIKKILSKNRSNEATCVSPVFDIELRVKKGGKTQKLPFDRPFTITLKYDINRVSNLENLGVYNYNEKTNRWEYVGGKANRNGTIMFTVDHFGKYAIMEYNKKFVDVDITWANHEIEVLTARHIIDGVDSDDFAPYNNITRAEFSKLIVKALNLESGKNIVIFKDVEPGKWYTDSVNIAASLGLVTGYDGKFNPNDDITREEMATIIVRILKHVDATGDYTISGIDFADKDEISTWAKEAAAIAENKGLINGIGENRFAPKKTATRAEAAVVIYRLLKFLDKI